jgi:AcrR family transcriptional regulator
MTPRRYQLGQRAAGVKQTKERIVAAAYALLTGTRTDRFTVEAVARRADVARQTVYDQFGGRAALIEAVFDELANRNDLHQLPRVYQEPDQWRALSMFVAVFNRFWSAERAALRRIRGYAAVDAELGRVVSARDQRRRHGSAVLVGRIAEHLGRTGEGWRAVATDTLFCLTSFETFDCLAGEDRTLDEITRVIVDLCRFAIEQASHAEAEAQPLRLAAPEMK